MPAQFLHNNLVKFRCARLNIFKLCTLKTLILKGLNRYGLPIALFPLKRAAIYEISKRLTNITKMYQVFFFIPYKLVI